MYDTELTTAEDADAHFTNVLAMASVAVGVATVMGQPLGCCLSIVATIPLFVAGVVGVVLGLSAYRQAQLHNLAGFELSVAGLTLGALNVAFSIVWCGVSTCTGLLSLLAWAG